MEFKHYYSNNKVSVVGSVSSEYSEAFLKSVSNSDKTIDLIFTIDTSGSMQECLGLGYYGGGALNAGHYHFGAYNTSKSKSKIVCNALMRCIEYLQVLAKNGNKIRLSVISFKESSNVVIDKLEISESEDCIKVISQLEHMLMPEGGTDIYKALIKSKEQIEDVLKTNTIDNVSVFVMTDGHNSTIQDNPKMVEFFKSCEYKDRFIGIGIGNITDYDNVLMNQLFENLKGSPSSEELTDNIISDTFGACSTVFKDFQIVFQNIKDYKYYTPLEIKKTETNQLIYNSNSVDFSQKFIFTFENDVDFESPISMEVSYFNLVKKEKFSEIILLNTGIVDDETSLNKVNVLCKLVDEFKKMSQSFIKYEDNLVSTQKMLEKFSEWKEDERSGIIGELWTANESIVKNHQTELKKYNHVELYAQYSGVLSKQTSNTMGVGRAPTVTRAISGGVVQQYSSGVAVGHTKSNPIPTEYDESIYNIHPAISPFGRMQRQNAMVSISGGREEDDKQGGYVQKEELDIE